MKRLNRGEEKSLERTLERRSDLISNENFKKSPQSKRIIKENNQFMKFRIEQWL